MRLLNFTVIKLSFCLIAGIIIARLTAISLTWSIGQSIALLSLLCISLLVSKKQFIKSIWFGVLAFSTTLSIGILVTHIHNEKLHKSHYTQIYSLKNNALETIQFRVRDILKSGYYNDKYIIDLETIGSQKVTGKALLNIKKDSLNYVLKVDEVYITKTNFKPLNAPLNPNQFNYKAYLEKQYIYHQISTESPSLLKVHGNIKSLNGYASHLRFLINSKLKTYNFKPDELAIINALILGQRQDISKNVYTNYTNAGAIHILAVSGLHVGILLLILNLLLKPLERLKHGRTTKLLIILILLWSYAILAGASASIIRASTMFSIVAFGMHLKRPSNIYNTLAISVFFILLFKPLFLFDVGFQLSYLAVIAIVSIQPILYNLWKPKLWFINNLWQVFTVTIAAQFGVIPLSLFYFHQFPGLFWLSNLVVIPLLGIILSSGILVIALALINVLPQYLADLYGTCISFMNYFFKWVSSHDQFLIKDISFNAWHTLASYFIIIAIVRVYVSRSHKTLLILGIAIVSFQLVSFYNKYEQSKDAFIIFHKSRHTIIGKKHSRQMVFSHNLKSIENDKTIANFTIANYISHLTEDSLQNLYIYQKEYILIVDSLGVYNTRKVNPDYVLLQNSPKLNLERLIDSITPKIIIADGSNYKSYIERWRATCKKRKLPFHHTGKKGAFILK